MSERERRMAVERARRALRSGGALRADTELILDYLGELEADLRLRECDESMQRTPDDRCGRCWPCRLSGNGRG